MPSTSTSIIDPDALIAKAREIAAGAHAGQFRRDGVTPYIGHPEAVASRAGDDPVAVAAAWLHDVIEDSDLSAEDLMAQGMPREVVEVVSLLTHADDQEYECYLSAIAAHPIARRIKIADMLTNLSDRPTDRQIVKYAKGLLTLMSGAEPAK